MRALRQRFVWVALVLGVWLDFRAPVQAQPLPSSVSQAGMTNLMPPLLKSPVDTFRELLAMKSAEREQYLTKRPPQVRERIEQKLKEYEAMQPDEREAKLNATQLRWYLEQFILTPSADLEAQLAQVPAPYREILKQRLGEFERLPAPLQKQVMEHESTRAYFLGQNMATNRSLLPPSPRPPPPMPGPLNELSRLPAAQREQVYASFQNFFDLADADRQKVLDTLPLAERLQVGKTLQALERLPKGQRDQGLRSIGRLAGLTDEQRRMFFSNAGRWKEMAPAEREAWLKLVSHLPPQPPAELLPPPPMLLPSVTRPGQILATNSPVP